MKLIVQIPCLNEEKTLPRVLEDIPRSIEGFSTVEVLVVDDGSSDDTVEVAQELGVEHIIRLQRRRGLAHAFSRGLEESVRRGADVIVNTDGDNQYRGQDIAKLARAVLEGEAQLIVGCRDIVHHNEFSRSKKFLQILGSSLVSYLSGLNVPDATSGFRAYSREAALRLTIHSSFSYTIETLLQAQAKRISVGYKEISVNEKTRESRLFSSVAEYLLKSGLTIVRVVTAYNPIKVFTSIGAMSFFLGFLIGLRFLYYLIVLGEGSGKIQSLILVAILTVIGVQGILVGLLADATRQNRLISEELLYSEKEGLVR